MPYPRRSNGKRRATCNVSFISKRQYTEYCHLSDSSDITPHMRECQNMRTSQSNPSSISPKGVFDIASEYIRNKKLYDEKGKNILQDSDFIPNTRSSKQPPMSCKFSSDSAIKIPDDKRPNTRQRHPLSVSARLNVFENPTNDNPIVYSVPKEQAELNECTTMMNDETNSQSLEAPTSTLSSNKENESAYYTQMHSITTTADALNHVNSNHQATGDVGFVDTATSSSSQDTDSRSCDNMVNVHKLVNALALAGLALSENKGQLDASVSSYIASVIQPVINKSQSVGRSKSTAQTRCSSRQRDRIQGQLPRSKSVSGSLSIPSFTPPRHLLSSMGTFSSRHPFLHYWEHEDKRVFSGDWQSRRATYLALRMATSSDSHAPTTASDAAVPQTNGLPTRPTSARSNLKRLSALKRGNYALDAPAKDLKTLSTEVAFQDKALSAFEPRLLGYRWSEGAANLDVMKSPNECEAMVLWQ